MVLFPLEPSAAAEALELAIAVGCAVWLGSDAVSDDEYDRYGRAGVKVSRFIYPLAEASPDVVEASLQTIVLHHPNETVWVQRRASA